MPKKKRMPVRVISFIGGTDLKAAGGASSTDPGPIWRFVSHQWDEGDLRNGDSILLIDDRPDQPEREGFRRWLQCELSSLGARLVVERVPLDGPGGPTDLKRLFEATIKRIPIDDGFEAHFLLSPGTPAMFATLVLASEYLRLGRWRLFECSREKGVVEVTLPYKVGLRSYPDTKPAFRRLARKPSGRLRGLLPGSVVEDPDVLQVYKDLHRRSTMTPRAIVIHGARGTGKTHAARQFARWRGDEQPWEGSVEAVLAGPAIDAGKVIIVKDIHAARSAWAAIKQVVETRSDCQFILLFRDLELACVDVQMAVDEGLAPGGCYRLPLLAQREDQRALVECFAKQAGSHAGKVHERFQYVLVTGAPATNLHALRSWVASAAAISEQPHISEEAIDHSVRALEATRAEEQLRRVAAVLADQSFVGHLGLETMLKAMEALTIRIQEGINRGQEAVCQALQYKRSTLYDKGPRQRERDRALRDVLQFLARQERAADARDTR